MFCSNCGKELDQRGSFCPYCGATLNKPDSFSHSQEEILQKYWLDRRDTVIGKIILYTILLFIGTIYVFF